MAGTRPRKITFNGKTNPPQFIHDIDQLVWYYDIKQRTSPLEEKPEEALNAVRFLLPYVPGRLQPYIIVAGDGLSVANVYLARLNHGKDLLTGTYPLGNSGLWKIFSYSDENKKLYSEGRREKIKKMETGLPIRLSRIFTTDIMPFLKGGIYWQYLECDRIYNFNLSMVGSDSLQIVAKNREKRKDQELEIIYVQDSRKGSPKSLFKIQEPTYMNPKSFEESFKTLPFTDMFSFADTINTNAL